MTDFNKLPKNLQAKIIELAYGGAEVAMDLLRAAGVTYLFNKERGELRVLATSFKVDIELISEHKREDTP